MRKNEPFQKIIPYNRSLKMDNQGKISVANFLKTLSRPAQNKGKPNSLSTENSERKNPFESKMVNMNDHRRVNHTVYLHQTQGCFY